MWLYSHVVHNIYSYSEHFSLIKRSPPYQSCINPDLKVYGCIHVVVKCRGGTTCITHLYLECLLCARLYAEHRIGCLHVAKANRCVCFLPPGTIGTSQRGDSFGLMGQMIIFVSSHSEFYCEVKVILLFCFHSVRVVRRER